MFSSLVPMAQTRYSPRNYILKCFLIGVATVHNHTNFSKQLILISTRLYAPMITRVQPHGQNDLTHTDVIAAVLGALALALVKIRGFY
jgi:hypothetical protein